MGVKAISQALELVPSTGLHILRVLVAEELVKVDPPPSATAWASGMLSLARTVLEGNDFATLVQPRLDELSRRYGVTAIGVELPELDHMVVVALSHTQTPVRLHVDIGSRFPGADQRDRPLRRRLRRPPMGRDRKRFRALRWQNPPSYEAWRKEVEAARRQGYSIDRGNYIAGVTVVAVPVPEPAGTNSQTLASVGISASSTARDRWRWRTTCWTPRVPSRQALPNPTFPAAARRGRCAASATNSRSAHRRHVRPCRRRRDHRLRGDAEGRGEVAVAAAAGQRHVAAKAPCRSRDRSPVP